MKKGSELQKSSSALLIYSGWNIGIRISQGLSSSLEAAHEVASCTYEYGTEWGNKIGLLYGSTAEDILTRLSIHSKGWRSTYCTPDPPAFMGWAPNGGPAAMTQMKRWASSLLKVPVGKNSPVSAMLFGKLQLRMCMAYVMVLLWAVRSIPETMYALLPASCIITNTHILPKVFDPMVAIPVLLFSTYYLFTLFEYFQVWLSVRAWLDNQRMQRVTSTCAWSFGLLGVILKLFGISQTVFEVSKKETSDPREGDTFRPGKFTFDESPMFIPGTALALVELMALAMMLLGLGPKAHGNNGSGVGEVLCAVCTLLSFGVFIRGLFKKKGGIPMLTVLKLAVLTTLFVQLSLLTSRTS
ncbi:hypothetical protein MLD38_025791 [Melastoma candidum]|uniref:Uncharacterized protein n=1 Tax=Melastoma candidum TaxID=119954 RepID=A0ACB9NZN6_9MYRT|nr:hypothetical protein MLD38_025791 [Melastoma candidum]